MLCDAFYKVSKPLMFKVIATNICLNLINK